MSIERPARAEHGDFATNHAMQLAPVLRRSPMQIADALRTALGTPPGVSEVTVAAPGFLNLRLDDAWIAGSGGRDQGDRIVLWPGGGRTPPGDQRRVRLRQPDRPAHGGQRARCVRRRPAQPRPGGGRTPRHAGVLLQRLRGAGPQPRPVRAGTAERRADPRGRLPRRLRQRTCDRDPRRGLGGCRRRRTPTRAGSWADGRRSGCGSGSSRAWNAWASISTSGRARARSTTKGGSSERSVSCATPGTSTRPTAPPGSAPRPSATTRTVSCIGQTERPPTSRPTSATSSRSSAAASTTSSTCGALTTTERWRGFATPPRRWARTARRCR